MRRSYTKIYIYISKELIFSFLVSFLFFFFLFFVNQILVLAEVILSKRIPLWDVLLLIFFSLPAIIALSAPFGSLVGALMTVGRLSSDNEILSMQAVGVSLPRIFIPIFCLSIIISLMSFIVNDYFLPLGILNFNKHYKKIVYQMPQLELESYMVKKINDTVLITGDVKDNLINNLLIIDKDTEKNNRVISSSSAELIKGDKNSDILSLKLLDVLGLTPDKKVKNDFEYFESDKMLYNILLKDLTNQVQNLSPREMSSYDVYQEIKKKEKDFLVKKTENRRSIDKNFFDLSVAYSSSTSESVDLKRYRYDDTDLKRKLRTLERSKMKIKEDRSIHSWKLEFNQKFSLPFSCIVFTFIAFPIGLFSKRSGRSVGFGIGVLLSLIYWGLLVSGRTLGYKANLNPVISMWTPNILMFTLGLILFSIRLKR
ncbi:LptF/LptG family permease [Spirochaeta cellobiosiphila]|uniref:LptF/LptG family permease n=1 Tax=Spirochaeta cellobiosiphila TaxID=504483 RepID=UPI0003FBCF3B|nr:LptF/LptG family permease [Spirochaeta cellobiosiphila]